MKRFNNKYVVYSFNGCTYAGNVIDKIKVADVHAQTNITAYVINRHFINKFNDVGDGFFETPQIFDIVQTRHLLRFMTQEEESSVGTYTPYPDAS